MKLYELFNKIGKGEVKEGTRVKQLHLGDTYTYLYRDGGIRSDISGELQLFRTTELNDEVEIIEPAKDSNASTKIEEIEFCVGDVTCNEENSYREEIDRIFTLIDKILWKQNEVIKTANKLTADCDRLNRNEDAKRFG